MPDTSLSLSAAAILQAIDHGYGYGFDIMDATGLPSGTVYPALRRMEAAGLIASRWEVGRRRADATSGHPAATTS